MLVVVLPATPAAAGATAAPTVATKAARKATPPQAVPAALAGTPGSVRHAPGYATTSDGRWVTNHPWGYPGERTTVTVRGRGTPLWADWDRDGVATPGRYQDGLWTITNDRVGTVSLRSKLNFGGVRGDVPVVGDIDGDRRIDYGIVRGGNWSWQLGNGKRAYATFGTAAGRKLVGDWNGDGRSDIGVVAGNRWQLLLRKGDVLPVRLPPAVQVLRLVPLPKPAPKGAKTPDAKPTPLPLPLPLVVTRGKALVLTADGVLTFRYGSASDVPLVGDWNGDRTWTPAVVQGGSRWQLATKWKRLATPATRGLAIPAGAVPIAVPTPTNSAPGRCLTAAPGATSKGYALAAKVTAPLPVGRYNPAGDWTSVRDSLRGQAGYLVSSDLTGRLAAYAGSGYADIISTDPVQEYAVRRTANAAFTTGMAVATRAWDDAGSATGLAYSDWLVRSIACQYRTVSPGGWGATWQSSLWVGVAGLTGWYAWDRLSPDQRAYVAVMVTDEADLVAARKVTYWKNPDGTYPGDPGDTKAEEMSWDTFAPALAAAMFPTDPRAARWRTAVVQRGLASYATPADLAGNQVVNGIALKSFLRGTNANDDGTVVNHQVLNPDYLAAISQLWGAAAILRAGRVRVPRALLHNSALVYGALSTVKFPADLYPQAPEPRGPIYQPDGSIYFPGTVSWGRDRRGLWASLDGLANVWEVGPKLESAGWLGYHIAGQRELQSRYSDGHTYGAAAEDVYRGGREEYNGQQLAIAYWTRALGYAALMFDDGTYSAVEP